MSKERAKGLDHIQGLRAVAVGSVLVFHLFDTLPGGFLGVDIFFVISGYVIGMSLLRNYDGRKFNFSEFISRRFWRLAPALASVLLITLLLSSFWLPPLGVLQDAALTGVAATIGASNVVIAIRTGDYFNPAAESNPLLHTWSLAVEAQFYIGLALALVVMQRVINSNHLRALLWTISLFAGSLSLLALALRFNVDGGAIDEVLGFYSPVTRVWQFAIGLVLSLLPGVLPGGLVPKRTGNYASWAAIILLLVSLSGSFGLGFPSPGMWLVSIATAVLLTAVPRQSKLHSILSSRFMVWIGDRSYSIYLWHWPIFVILEDVIQPNTWRAIVSAGLTLVFSAVSFRVLERPFMDRISGLRDRIAKFVAPVLGTTAVIGVLLWAVPQIVWEERFETATEKPPGYSLGCHGPENSANPDISCYWLHSAGAIDDVILVGDSNAAMHTRGLVAASRKLERNLIVMTASGCPFSPIPQPEFRQACIPWQERAADEIGLMAPTASTIVLGFSQDYWRQEPQEDGVEVSQKEGDSFQIWLESTARFLSSLGYEVIVVNPIPHWDSPYEWALRDCKLTDVLGGCDASMPLGRHTREVREIHNAIYKLSDAEPNILVANVTDLVCPQEVCATRSSEGIQVYKDGTHITNEFSETTASRWEEVLGR